MVFLLLQAVFTSWRLATFVFVTLPMAVAGGVLTGLLGGELVSIGTLAGLFAVLAVSVRTSITLIDHLQRLERAGGTGSGQELILSGAQDRLGPTLTTVLATAVGVLPFIVLGEVAGLEVARPMAIFIIGGLITSTLVTLFVVPDIYMRAGPRPEVDTESLSTEQPALEPTVA
jgi:Cu/Ag efflux pump CusA